MNWITLIGAIGLGSIVVKIFDIWWLERVIEKRDIQKWLREQRLKAFTNLAQCILSFGLAEQHGIYNPFEFYAVATEAILLIDDKRLISRIDQFIVSWDVIVNEKDKIGDKQAQEYSRLCKERREIVDVLRQELLRNNRNYK